MLKIKYERGRFPATSPAAIGPTTNKIYVNLSTFNVAKRTVSVTFEIGAQCARIFYAFTAWV